MTEPVNTADFVRAQLKAIDDRAPATCSNASEHMDLIAWRGACRDMARMAREALSRIEESEKDAG